MSISEAIEQIIRIQKAGDTNQKTKILQENQTNEDFRKLLYYAINPRLTYKVSERTLSVPAWYDPAITLTLCDIYEVCDTLSNRKAVDDATLYQVRSFLSMCDPEKATFYKKLLSKTLRLGVTGKTVDKVMPGLIPEWEVQQSYPIFVWSDADDHQVVEEVDYE